MNLVAKIALVAALLSPAPAIALDTADLAAARRQIRELLVAGQGERALAAIEPLLAAHGDDAGLHALRGEALFELERHPEAVTAFERAGALDPALRGRIFNHGRALQELGRHPEAIAIFEALRRDDEPARRAQGAFGVGLSRAALGDDAAAAEAFRAALRDDPTSQRARYRLALLDIAAGRDAEAESALAVVLADDPLHHGAAYNRALALGRLGREEESEAAWQLYRRVLEGKQRVTLLEERLAGDATDLERLVELGRVHAELGAHAAAIGWFQRAGGIAPVDPRPALGAVASLRALGRAADAEALCAMLLARDPPIEELRAPLIEMLEARGAKEEAAKWRRPAAPDPSSQPPRS